MLSRPSLTIEGDDLVVREWLRRRKWFALRSIRRIESVKTDKVTYEENHLLLELEGGKVVALGQPDRVSRRWRRGCTRSSILSIPTGWQDWRADRPVGGD